MSASHPQFTARIEGAPETIFDLIADMPNYGDHPITIERNLKRVVVSVGDAVLSDSRDALILREAGYPAVQYIPQGCRHDAARAERSRDLLPVQR
jgi:hypothetical protein